jgi:hypothetical protein
MLGPIWRMTDDALGTTSWRYYELFTSRARTERLAATDLFWASERVDQMAKGGIGVVDLFVTLSDTAKDDAARADLGWGPVKDFIRRHRQTFNSEIEAASRQNLISRRCCVTGEVDPVEVS